MIEKEDNLVRLPTYEKIEEEAADWFARLRTGGLRPEEMSEFEAWRCASDRHKQVFSDLEALWGEFGALEELEDLGRSALGIGLEPSHGRRRRVFVGMAAALAAVVIGGGVFFNNFNSRLGYQEAALTAVGEQKTLSLADGSKIQMNTDSEIVIKYTSKARTVRLMKGEASFTVAKDKGRPFTVLTDNGAVTAVGTEFTVRMRPGAAIEVTVAEGRVALTPQNKANTANSVESELIRSAPIAELTRGQVALFQSSVESIDQVTETELNRKLSWRQGMLAYSGESLEEVVADVSRYTDVEIEISDPDIKNLTVRGYFKVGETEVLFEILELTFGLNVDRIDERRVRLSKAV